MKASEYIKELQAAIDMMGDLEVVAPRSREKELSTPRVGVIRLNPPSEKRITALPEVKIYDGYFSSGPDYEEVFVLVGQ